jgi:hypothetical protein
MPLPNWWNFFYFCGSASVTLTGLMFVAVTLGSTLIKKETLNRVDAFLSTFYRHFVQVFFISASFAVPFDNPKIIAAVAAGSGLLRLAEVPSVYKTVRELRNEAGEPVEREDWVSIVYLPTAIYSALIVAGVCLWLNYTWALYLLAACCFSLLISAAKQAWERLVWIASILT